MRLTAAGTALTPSAIPQPRIQRRRDPGEVDQLLAAIGDHERVMTRTAAIHLSPGTAKATSPATSLRSTSGP